MYRRSNVLTWRRRRRRRRRGGEEKKYVPVVLISYFHRQVHLFFFFVLAKLPKIRNTVSFGLINTLDDVEDKPYYRYNTLTKWDCCVMIT